MSQDKADKAVKALENTIKELSGLDELTSGIKSLENTIVDSNEELIATFVEGTKRLIKKPNQDVSPLLRKLDETTSTKLDSLKSGVGEVERAVKSLKFPSSADFRSPAAILKLPIKELTRAIGSFELPKEAKDAIPVRLSDGDKFYKALDGIVQQISGGGATSYAFDNQGGSPTKAATVQVSVGGKTRDALVVVNPDGTEVGGASAGGGLTDAELRATPVPISGTVTANLSATDNTVLDNIDADTSAIQTSVELIDDAIKAEDSAHSSGDKGVFILAVRNSSNSALTTTDGDYSPINVDDTGSPQVVIKSGQSKVTGNVSSEDADSGEPVKVGGKYNATPISLTDGDRGDLQLNQAGDLKVSLDSESVAVTGTFWQATQPVSGTVTANLSATDNAVLDAIAADTTTIAGDTTSIDAKIPALGQALAAGSVPVVLTAAQLTTLTPLATVAVTQSGTWDEVGINDSGNSLTVDAPVGTPVFVRLSDGAAAITTLPVSLASVPSHAVTNAGTFAVQVDGAALTALQLIDNLAVAVDGNYLNVNMNVAGTDVVSGSGTATGALRVELPTNGTGVVGLNAGTNAIGKLAANSGVDIGDVDVTSVSGTVTTKGIPSDIDINGSNANHAQKYYTNAGAVTDGIIWSPAAGKRWHILYMKVNVSADCTVTLEDDLSGGDSVLDKNEFAAKSGITYIFDKEHPWCSGEDAADLIITTTAGNVYVLAVGYEI